MSAWRTLAITLAAALAGCVYVPTVSNVYDPACHIEARQMTLQPVQLGGFGQCAGDGCIALLVGVGAVTAASVVVSGTIVVAGNTYYWFEKRGQCKG